MIIINSILCMMSVFLLGAWWGQRRVYKKTQREIAAHMASEAIAKADNAEPLNDLSKSWHGHLTPEEINRRGLSERLMQLAREEAK